MMVFMPPPGKPNMSNEEMLGASTAQAQPGGSPAAPRDLSPASPPRLPRAAAQAQPGAPSWLRWTGIGISCGLLLLGAELVSSHYEGHAQPPARGGEVRQQPPAGPCPGYRAIRVETAAGAIWICGGLPYPPAGVNSRPCRVITRHERSDDPAKRRAHARAREEQGDPAVSWCEGSPNNHGHGQSWDPQG